MICRREHSDSKGNFWNGLWFVWKHWKSTYHKVSDHRIVYRHSMFGFVFMVVCAKRTFHKKICSDQHDKMPLKFYVLTLLSFISIAVTTRANLHLFCRASDFVKIQTISYIHNCSYLWHSFKWNRTHKYSWFKRVASGWVWFLMFAQCHSQIKCFIYYRKI